MNDVLKKVGRQIEGRALQALVGCAVHVREDLVESGLMPFESGHLQNSATYVDVSQVRAGVVSVVSDTVYARRKFFHPEFEFDQSVNALAGGRWFDEYTVGGRKNVAFDGFAEWF